jgi:hypothetical protein
LITPGTESFFPGQASHPKHTDRPLAACRYYM